MARFFAPHPNDGTGPGVLLPAEVKAMLDSLDGEDLTPHYAVDSIFTACRDAGVDADVTDRGDYIQLRTYPHGRGQYPQHVWKAISYET